MSSLAAARADNYYYGAEYDPRKHGGLNKYRGSHPLGERAKRLAEGILIIRFEMPYKTECLSCRSTIDKGVRFNAEKKQVGSYYSTKIYEFTFYCYYCRNKLCIQTDPKNSRYVCTIGLREKVVTFDCKDIGTLELEDEEERNKVATNPMYKLEKFGPIISDSDATNNETTETTAFCSKTHQRIIADLYCLQKKRGYDSYAANVAVRSNFRKRKKMEIAEEAELNLPKNFALPLIKGDSNTEKVDSMEVKNIKFLTDKYILNTKLTRARLHASSIFFMENLKKGFETEYQKKQKEILNLVAKKHKIKSVIAIEQRFRNVNHISS